MLLDPTFLSRIQFAFTVTFHILFPALSIGLSFFLAIMEGLWLKTQDTVYLQICKFWTKIFALTFGMGVVSGIVMEFQFGTNWSGFTNVVGPVLGSLFTYEVLTAFFIEAGFLGVMIFGWNRVSPRLHYVATLLVVTGVTLSAFWILSANSWMQTPAGATLQHGKFVVNDWWQVIFNPLVIPRYIHMLLAAFLCTLFVIAGISGHYLVKMQHREFAKKCFSFALAAIIILIPLQILMGDTVGLKVHQYQPLKTAAIEGVWETQKGAPLLLFAYPDQAKQANEYVIGIPHMASVINTHKWNGQLLGLKTVAPADQPVVAIVFYSFRIMVGIGLLMLLIGLIGLWLRLRSRLYDTPWFAKLCQYMAPLGFVALITGWFTAESGRQPWVVYNILRTSDAVSPVSWHDVIVSLVLIIIVYGIIFGIFYFYYLSRIIKHGPVDIEVTREHHPFQYLSAGPEVEKKL